jgi:hypothetical protein
VSDVDRGCVFSNFGEAYGLRLLVAVHSLRRFYDGPVTVLLAPDPAGLRLQDPLEELDCQTIFTDGLSKSWDRHRIFELSPYRTTMSFDSDLVFEGPIDDLWEPLEREGLLVTRFYAPPYGVEGGPEMRGWADRVSLLESTRELVSPATHDEALRRLVEEKVDVNIGVIGISRPRGDGFLEDWVARMEEGREAGAPLLDEMLVVALLVRHSHFLADEVWNCPADEYFRRTNPADARVIHYFADGHRVEGHRMGRNPSTWAGRKWYQAQERAGERLNLEPWMRRDPTYSRRREESLRRAAGAAAALGRSVLRPLRSRLAKHVRYFVSGRAQRFLERLATGLGLPVRLDGSARTSVVILSYKRMANIQAIAESALRCDFVDYVLVSNNNPEVDLRPYLDLDDPRFELIQQPVRRGPAYRYDLARECPGNEFLCLDDDVFLGPWQLRRLVAALRRDPSVPRGIGGEIYDSRVGRLRWLERRPPFWRNQTRPVDVILQAYAFTRAHLERYFQLLDAISLRNDNVPHSEDVILSLAGVGRPILEDVGFVYRCTSSRDPAIAIHQSEGFVEFRQQLYRKLKEVT